MPGLRAELKSLMRPAAVEDLSADAIRGTRAPGMPPNAKEARTAIVLCLRVGELLLVSGMAANDVVVTLLRMSHAYGVAPVHMDLTYTALTMSYYPDADTVPITMTRVVQPGHPDYFKAQRLQVLCDRALLGMPLPDAIRLGERIRSAPRRYPWWVPMVGNAGVGTGFALMYTTSVPALIATFVIATLTDRLVTWLGSQRMPPFFTQAFGAGFITLAAAGLAAAGRGGVPFLAGLYPTHIVVGGVIMLAAGTLMVAAVQDAIDQFYITASARLLQALLLTAGIVVGLLAGLNLAFALGIGVYVDPKPESFSPETARVAGAFIVPIAWALYAYAGRATALLSGFMGVLGYVSFLLAREAGMTAVAANTLAAFGAAFAATLIVRRTNIPAFGVIASALLPLVPGLALYNGITQVVGTVGVQPSPDQGAQTLMLAVGVALGIAAGASLGVYFGRPLVQQMRRITDRTFARRGRRPEPDDD